MAQTTLRPVILDIITDSDIDDMKQPLQHREIRFKTIDRWTRQAHDQGALLTQLDLAVLLTTSSATAGEYVRDFESVKLLSTKFDDVDVISRIIRLTSSVVKQYLDLIPLDS